MTIQNDYLAGVPGWLPNSDTGKRQTGAVNGTFGANKSGVARVDFLGRLSEVAIEENYNKELDRPIGAGRDVSDVYDKGGIDTKVSLSYPLIDDNVDNSRLTEALFGTVNGTTGVITPGNTPIDHILEYPFGSESGKNYRMITGLTFDEWKLNLRENDVAMVSEALLGYRYYTAGAAVGTLPSTLPTSSPQRVSGNWTITLGDATLTTWLVPEVEFSLKNNIQGHWPVANSRYPAAMTCKHRDYAFKLKFLEEGDRVRDQFSDPSNSQNITLTYTDGASRYLSIVGVNCKLYDPIRHVVSKEAKPREGTYTFIPTGGCTFRNVAP